MNGYLTAALGFLAVTLVIFHLPIAWVLRSKTGQEWLKGNTTAWKRHWEVVDYLWLGLAVLSLIPLANNLSRIVNQNEIGILVNYSWYEDIGSSIEGSISMLEDDQAYEAELKWLIEALHAFQQSSRLMTEARTLIRDGDGDEAMPRLREATAILDDFLMTHPTERLNQGMIQEYVGYFEMFRQDIAELETEYLGTQVGEWEEVFNFYFPSMLAVALGVRIAKVSAKVFAGV